MLLHPSEGQANNDWERDAENHIVKKIHNVKDKVEI
jgi:hypothetical protein